MVTLAGRPCSSAELAVPWRGRWVAHAVLPGAAPTGRVTLAWGAATLIGSVDPTGTGVWQGETRVTIVGGIGWARVLPALWLQNDAGLSGLAVAQQAATLAGETLQADTSAFRALRVSYSRPRREAGAIFGDVLVKGATWWVGFDGITRAGVRPSPAAHRAVEVLEHYPSTGEADLDASDPSQVLVGSIIAAAPPRRPRAFRIVELRASVGEGGQKFSAAVEVL